MVLQSAFPGPGSEPADVTLSSRFLLLGGAGVVSEAVTMDCPAVVVSVKNVTGQSEGCQDAGASRMLSGRIVPPPSLAPPMCCLAHSPAGSRPL